ncbi:hypothetical protein BS78_10G162900 [Paspalum vaginatum]|nr:hypothetical protein BS78_10G162900 [Paspalum vaginatum]
MSSKSSFDSSESSTSGSSRSTCLSICKLLFVIFIPTGNMDYNSNSSWHAVRKNMDYNSNSSGHASVKEQYHYVKELLLPSFDGLKASCSMHKVHDASMVEHL